MKVRNLTPHPIRLFEGDSLIVELPPEGPCPRITHEWRRVDALSFLDHKGRTLPVGVITETGIEDLPAWEAWTYLIVSRAVAKANPDRPDLVFPDDPIREKDGKVIGCRRLAKFSHLNPLGSRYSPPGWVSPPCPPFEALGSRLTKRKHETER